MNKFIETYLEIIEEGRFKNKKWKLDKVYKDVEILENYEHLKERLIERYKIEYASWISWKNIKQSIIDHLLKIKAWKYCKGKNNYQRMFSVHLTTSDMWCGFIIHNDVEEKMKRIYFTTFLPSEEVMIHPHVNRFDLPL